MDGNLWIAVILVVLLALWWKDWTLKRALFLTVVFFLCFPESATELLPALIRTIQNFWRFSVALGWGTVVLLVAFAWLNGRDWAERHRAHYDMDRIWERRRLYRSE